MNEETTVRLANSLLLLAGCLALQAFAADPVAPSMTLSAVAAQLSKAVNRDVIWQAPYGATVEFESDPQPMTVEDFVSSIEKLNRRMVNERPELAPFVVCIFPNALVVRTVVQPKCGKPLN